MPILSKHRRLVNLKRKRTYSEDEIEGEVQGLLPMSRELDFTAELPQGHGIPMDGAMLEVVSNGGGTNLEETEEDFVVELQDEDDLEKLRNQVQRDAWAFLTRNQTHNERTTGRPTHYNKAQPASGTLRNRMVKARKAEEERRAKGFADIRNFFPKSSGKAKIPSAENSSDIEEIFPPELSASSGEIWSIDPSECPRPESALPPDCRNPITVQPTLLDIETESDAEKLALGLVGGMDQEETEADDEARGCGERGVDEHPVEVEAIQYVTDTLQHQENGDYDSDDSASSDGTLCGEEELPPKDLPAAESPQTLSNSAPAEPSTEHSRPSNSVLQLSKIHHSIPQDPQLLHQTIESLEGLSRDRSIDLIFRGRLVAMLSFVRLFVAIGPRNGGWGKASLVAAVAAGGGPWVAKQLRRWVRAFMRNPDDLPINRYHNTHVSKISDEDLATEIHLHLQTKGKYLRAMDVVEYMGQQEVQEKWGLQRGISVRTAQRWMKSMSYRYQKEKNGQYKDGHEREDVVEYRQDVFLPLVEKLERRMQLRDKDGRIIQEPVLTPGEVPLYEFKHDESTFYANDRRRTRWVHASESPTPIRKGEGASIMVADSVSPEFGWCRSVDGSRSTRILFKAGKNRDGYFAAEDVQAQTNLMLDIFEEHFPNGSAIAVLAFDNAPSHQRRAFNALSARKMPKNTPKKPKNWFPSGQVKMRAGKLSNGSPQSLYFSDDHSDPTLAGQFKGMRVILEERGFLEQAKLNAECPRFKCPPRAKGVSPMCCCRRVLFEQPDFKDQKPELIELVEKRGHIAYFFPKYHCELNFIEMCWGAAKSHYRVQPPTSTEAEMEANVVKALDSVPLEKMRRYSIRASRFMDAYRKGLNGSQAAWANKKYHGHRTLPSRIMAEL